MANILTVADFWPAEKSNALIEMSEDHGFVDSNTNNEANEGQKHSHKCIVLEDEDMATKMWHAVKGYIPMQLENRLAIGINERFRIYKIDVGQSFKKHRDPVFVRTESESSFYSLMVSLNDTFEGGETQFEKFAIPAEKGMCLLFRHELEHASKPVLAGTKYILCTQVMYRSFG